MINRIKLALFATILAGCMVLSAAQAFAQGLPVCNWGDMIYRASTGYACLPLDNTPGKFLQGNGASAAPIWTFQAAAGFLLPTQSTNTFLGNTTGGNASPTPNTVSQILDTIGYDVSRPPTPGALLYKTNLAPNNAWQALAPPTSSGLVLSYAAGAPIWAANAPTLDGYCTTQGAVLFRNAAIWNCLQPGVVGQFLITNGINQDVNWQTVSTTTLGAVPTTRLVSTGTGLSGGGDLSADRTLSITSTIAAGGPVGSATTAPIITYNAQGQLTAVSSATVTPAFSSLTGQITLAQMTTLGANTTLGNGTGSGAVPTALTMPSCSTANSALQWVSGTGYQCASLGTGGTVTSVSADGGVVTGTGAAITGSGTVYTEQMTPGGRLSLTASTPVTTTDVAAATVMNYPPMTSRWVPINNGTVMRQYQFTASDTDTVGLQVTLGANWAAATNYDWFVGLNGATVTLCSGVAWTSDTARGTGAGTTELQLFRGVWTNKVSMTCRYANASTFTCGVNQCTYIGSFRTVAAGQAEDSMAKRFLYNAYNQVQRVLKNVTETANNWTYTIATFRQANANTANQLDVMVGLAGSLLDAKVLAVASTSAGTSFAAVGIGINSTTVNSGQSMSPTPSTNRGLIQATYQGYPAIGRSYYPWIELSSPATGTTTFDGNGGNPTFSQSGISGTMLM